MLTLLSWLVFTAISATVIWQLIASEPFLPYWVSGLTLLAVGVIAGIRMGYFAATGYVKDLVRTNRFLGEQNQQLTEANLEMLKRHSAHNIPTKERTKVD